MLIRKAINSPAEVFNDINNGKQCRDFVLIDDVIDALVASLQKDSFKGAELVLQQNFKKLLPLLRS